FMTLLAGLQALLHHYAQAEDVLVGTPVANRNRAELEPLIGHFVNNLGLRGRVRAAALGAYDHQDLPFERLVDALGVERRLSHGPLFQVMLILHNLPLGALELPELTLRQVGVEAGTARVDLTLELVEDTGGLRG